MTCKRIAFLSSSVVRMHNMQCVYIFSLYYYCYIRRKLISLSCRQVTVFVLVCVLTLIVASPDNRYSKAGLYAIFATQSNDFALGYPIGKNHPAWTFDLR